MIAGTATTVVVVLVNGNEIIRTVIESRGGDGDGQEPEEGGEEEEPRKLALQIVTQDRSGARSTALDPKTGGLIWIQAWCEEMGKGALPAATQSIVFELTVGSAWATMSPASASPGVKAVLVELREELPPAPPGQTVQINVSAAFEDAAVSAPVMLELVLDRYMLRIS